MKEAPAADTNCTFTINMSTSGQASMCPKLLSESDSFVWQSYGPPCSFVYEKRFRLFILVNTGCPTKLCPLCFCYFDTFYSSKLQTLEKFRKLQEICWIAEWWAIWMSRSWQIAKNWSRHSFVGHPVRREEGQGIDTIPKKIGYVL